MDEELQRQLGLGAVALKIHPVHAGAAVNDRALYPAYEVCQSAGIPLVVHCGTSSFPGSSNALADPVLLDTCCVTSAASTSCSPTAAGAGGTTRPRSWPCPAPVSGSSCPACRRHGCGEYYAQHNWNRLTRKMIFGTDWPGVPGIAANARAVAALCPDEETAGLVLAGNALRVYNLKLPA